MSVWPILVDPVYGCWLWQGKLDDDGYPLLSNGRRALRVVYESEHGGIADGLELDHVCRRRSCVRHLEPVTREENERRKSWRKRSKRRMCVAGHDLALNAMITPEGGKICRICERG